MAFEDPQDYEEDEFLSDNKDEGYGYADIPESQIEFMHKLIEPALPMFQQIKRDIGLSKITRNDAELCEIYFEIARRARHMALLTRYSNPSISIVMRRLAFNYIEKIYEKLGINRSVEGFQWEALNKQIKEIRRRHMEKKKKFMMKQEEGEERYE
jgi:hypothetical protein